MSDQLKCPETMSCTGYLAGELSPADETAFRQHADSCDVCGSELAGMRTLVDRLRRIDPVQVDEEWELPSTLGIDLLRRAVHEVGDRDAVVDLTVAEGVASSARDRRHRGAAAPSGSRGSRRRRRIVIGALAAAASFGAGAGSVVGYQAATKAPPPKGESVKLRLLSASLPAAASKAPVNSWAWISTTAAGTYATLYARGLPAGHVYKMWFEAADGTRTPLGSFKSSADGALWLKCPGSSSLDRASIAAIGASADGADILRADLPHDAKNYSA